MYLQFLESTVSNPSQRRNVVKKKDALVVPTLDAGCQLISVFNKDINTTRKLTSVILKKGGQKKVAFKRLSPVYVSMGYGATNTLFESAGKGFDKVRKHWKCQVEGGVQREHSILQRLETAAGDDGAESELVQQLNEELDHHRTTMRPGYSFTGDNVDKRILPRQMTLTNKNKDHHMYQMVAFKNQISSNHLPNTFPKNDASQVLFSSFLPNAED